MENIDVVGIVSWGAIFAGVVIAMVFQMLLALLGLAMGLWQVKPASADVPAKKLEIGAAVWWVLASIISLYIGGWVAGRLAGDLGTFDSVLHGSLVWAITTLISAFVVTTTLGRIIGGALGTLMNALKATGKGVGSMAQGTISKGMEGVKESGGIGGQWSKMKDEIQNLLRQSGKPQLQPEHLKEESRSTGENAKRESKEASMHPENAQQEIETVVQQFLQRGQGTAKSIDRDAVANILQKRTKLSHEEARATADRWLSTMKQGESRIRGTVAQAQEKIEKVSEKAEEVTEQTAQSVGTAAFWSFVMLVVTLIAAGAGGATGAIGR